MAANNYFGFTSGGTQYGTTTTGYSTAQSTTGYAVQPAAQQYAAVAQRSGQSGYEGYQQAAAAAAGTNYQYATTTRPQTAYEKPQQQQQTYYQGQVSYSTTDYPQTADTTHYQQSVSNNKPVYSTNTNYTTRQANTGKAQNQGTQPTAQSYMYSTGTGSGNTAAAAATSYSTYSNAAAATTGYSAYVQPTVQAVQTTIQAAPSQQKSQNNNWMTYKKGSVRITRPKMPPKPQQLHYCEVCKISCAGPLTYQEHLEGQKHKKKEAAAKAGVVVTHTSRGGATLRCELCDVTCTGNDAYAAHIRGAKHQKVVKLHTKLGKPIPSTEPQVLSTPAPSAAKPGKGKGTTPKKTGPPKISFVAAASEAEAKADMDTQGELDDKEDEVQPVGQDYIEEVKSDDGKIVSFACKLCDCKFNDPNAKEMHMKGRRHRLQYKKKVNPDLVVDVKPTLRHRKIQDDRLRRHQFMEDFWKRREEERWREEMRMMEEEDRMYWQQRRYEDEMDMYEWHQRMSGRMGPPMPPMGRPFSQVRKPDSVDDRHVIAKHTAIYPKEEELSAVQKIVTNTEKALKLVSDFLTEEVEAKEALAKKVNTEPTEEAKTAEAADKDKDKEKDKDASQPYRVLKGVMRVGVLAKGLVLTGDLSVKLVVMCAEKPSKTLLEKVAQNLPKQMAVAAAEDKYDIRRSFEEAAIIVTSTSEPKIEITVTLTSPIMREETAEGETVKDPPDVLDRQKCLDALAALRHAKWFQARASGLQSCVMVIRILRDLCQRVPTWNHLCGWALELLVEKVISSANQICTPGDALRRVFEAIASGVLMPGSPGLLDPCEKDPTDATTSLSNQDREDITASAQTALRLISYRQIHKVLGMDPLPPPKFVRGSFTRKRRRDNSAGEGNDDANEQKKDKKDDGKMDAEEKA